MMNLFPTMKDEDYDLFDDVFTVPTFGREPLMRTDVHEKDGKYILEMNLPGVKKEDVKISLHQGNLCVEAVTSSNKEEKDSDGNVIRQERFSGNCSRTFYVGNGVKDADVHASIENGVLKIEVPSAETKKVEDTKYIDIL